MNSDRLTVAAGLPLRGRMRVPGDKSISHRALLLAALAPGRSSLTGLSGGEDVRHTAMAVARCRAGVTGPGGWPDAPAGGGVVDGTVTVDGGALAEPDGVLDVGNSGTGIRLLAGWVSPRPWLTVLTGDTSVSARPMDRVAEPLRRMGATVDGRDGGRLPPLVIRGGRLHGIDHSPAVASAQVKGCVLLAGLGAEGPTTVREAVPTRAHTEELLALAGVDVRVGEGTVTVMPGPVGPLRLSVPGDPSAAAFWAVAAAIVPGSDLTIEGVYLGPGRAGFVDVLRRMGADIEVGRPDAGTGAADLRIRAAPLRATEVGGREVSDLIDEIPVLAVAAALADGTTTFADAAELRVKESDRVATTAAGLRAVGAEVDERPDGLVVRGRSGRPLAGGRADSAGDHRIAMALAVAGLVATGPTVVEGWGVVATSYPGFEEEMARWMS